MRRTVLLLAFIVLGLLWNAPEVRGGGGQAGEPATGKISGPAVGATIVIDPTFGSPTIGKTGIRLQKGSSFSGAIFTHLQAALPPSSGGWILGCDGVLGASGEGTPGLNVNTLTALRFQHIRIRSWVPPGVLAPLFAALGIQLDEFHQIPVITDFDNAVCTAVTDTDFTGTKYILSFTAVIQFEDSLK